MLHCAAVELAVPGRVLCKGLTTTFGAGEVWAVLGRNGTGKTTLVHALAGLTRPRAGTVELDGRDIASIPARERARSVGVLLQIEEGTYWGSVADYVLLGRYPHAGRWTGFSPDDRRIADAALHAVSMRNLSARAYATLSGGERQRARIAQILAQEPRLTIFDEPLQHLDLAHQALVLSLVAARAREQREAAVMVLHEPLWIARSCTHALVLMGDGVAEAGPAEALLTRERLEHAYGLKLREVVDSEGRSFIPQL